MSSSPGSYFWLAGVVAIIGLTVVLMADVNPSGQKLSESIASQSVDQDSIPSGPVEASTEPQGEIPEPAEAPIQVWSESTALADVREAGLLPFQWPWFADNVQAPADAVAAASDLRDAIATIPDLSDFKVISAEEMHYQLPDGSVIDKGTAFVWLKVAEDQMMLLVSRNVVAGETPTYEAFDSGDDGYQVVGDGSGEQQVPLVGGEPVIRVRDRWNIFTTLTDGSRVVMVELHAVTSDTELRFDGQGLADIGTAVLSTMAVTQR
jgi:hypothetical protein